MVRTGFYFWSSVQEKGGHQVPPAKLMSEAMLIIYLGREQNVNICFSRSTWYIQQLPVELYSIIQWNTLIWLKHHFSLYSYICFDRINTAMSLSLWHHSSSRLGTALPLPASSELLSKATLSPDTEGFCFIGYCTTSWKKIRIRTSSEPVALPFESQRFKFTSTHP